MGEALSLRREISKAHGNLFIPGCGLYRWWGRLT